MEVGKILFIVISALLIPACASISVDQEFDPEANFAAYQTFGWMPMESRRVDLRARDPMVEQWIRDAIERELGAKGLRAAGSDEPDVRIAYLLVLQDGLDSQTIYEASDPNWRYRTYGPATTATRTQLLTTGTLVIDVFDAEKKALVWRGVAEGQVREVQDPDKRTARINDAVKRILAKFPPGS